MDVTEGPQPRRRHRFYSGPHSEPRCTPETPRCANARSYSAILRPCCRGHVIDIFTLLAELCAEEGIRWWLDYGSLLGGVRNPLLGLEPGIVPHDKDGDAGVLGEDYDRFRALRPRVEEAGFYWTESPERPGGNPFRGGNRVKIRRSQVNHTNVDIFPWYRVTPQNRQSFPWVTRTDDGMRHRKGYIGADRYKGREFPEAKLLPLTMMEWEGMELPAPADPLWFVEHRYGPNWRTPIARNNDGIRR